MSILRRPEGDLYYDICDAVPPWVTPKETVLFLNGLAINSDIWVTWLPELADQYRIVRTDLRGFGRYDNDRRSRHWDNAQLQHLLHSKITNTNNQTTVALLLGKVMRHSSKVVLHLSRKTPLRAVHQILWNQQ